MAETLEHIATTAQWQDNPLLVRLQRLKHAGFLEVSEFLAEMKDEATYHVENMREFGADWQVGSVVDMPDGGVVLFTFEREAGRPNFSPEELRQLDSVRPHLARAF